MTAKALTGLNGVRCFAWFKNLEYVGMFLLIRFGGTSSLHLVGYFQGHFGPQDGRSVFLRNVHNYLQDYMMSEWKRP
jgi:hypothetical protein